MQKSGKVFLRFLDGPENSDCEEEFKSVILCLSEKIEEYKCSETEFV
jgi:hypothetical protein